MQITAILFVSLNIRVNAFVTHGVPALLQLHATRNLIGASVILQILQNMPKQTFIVMPTFTIIISRVSALYATLLRSIRFIPAPQWRTIPLELSADRRLIATNDLGNHCLRMSCSEKSFELITLGTCTLGHAVWGERS